MGGAGDTLSNYGGQALNVINSLLAARSGNLPQTIAAQQLAQQNPQIRASLMNSPFSAGILGIGGGRGTVGSVLRGPGMESLQGFVPNLPPLSAQAQQFQDALTAATGNGNQGFEPTITMDSSGKQVVSLKPKKPAFDFTQLQNIPGGGDLQFTGVTVNPTTGNAQLMFGLGPERKAKATAEARKTAQGEKRSDIGGEQARALQAAGVIVPGQQQLTPRADVLSPNVGYPPTAPNFLGQPAAPSLVQPPSAAQGVPSSQAQVTGWTAPEGLQWSNIPGVVAEKAAIAGTQGLETSAALDLDRYVQVGRATKFIEDLGARNPERLSDFIGPIDVVKNKLYTKFNGALPADVAKDLGNFTAANATLYRLLVNDIGRQQTGPEFARLGGAYPDPHTGDPNVYLQIVHNLKQNATSSLSDFATALGAKVPPETQKRLTKAVKEYQTEPPTPEAGKAPGRNQMLPIAGGILGQLAGHRGLGRLAGGVLGAGLGSVLAQGGQPAAGPLASDVLFNGAIPVGINEGLTAAGPALGALSRVNPQTTSALGGLLGMIPGGNRVMTALGGTGLGAVIPAAAGLGARAIEATESPATKQALTAALGQVYAKANSTGQTLLAPLAGNVGKLGAMLASPTKLNQLTMFLGKSAVNDLQAIWAAYTRSAIPGALRAGVTAIPGALARPPE